MPGKYEATNDGSSNENFVDTRKSRASKFMYVLTFLSTIGGFLFGYDTGVVSGAMLLIRNDFQLTTAWHEAIVSVTVGAAWAFALIGGWLTDAVGRKPVILFASLVFTAGSVIMGLAQGKELLLVGRLIVGIGIGIASMSVPVYIAESSLPNERGRLVTINTLLITGGQFIAAAVCGAFSDHPDGWRYMLGLAGIPACIQFFGFLVMPESPRWLVSKKRFDEAYKVLRSIRSSEIEAREELENIKAACSEQENEEEIYGRGAFNGSVWLQVLRTPSTRRALILGCCLQCFQQLAGINTVMYYSASIIQMAGIKDLSVVIWLACATASVNFLFTFVGLYLVEKVGRRPLTLWSLGGVVVSLLTLGVSFYLMRLDTPSITIHEDTGLCGSIRNCADCVESISQCGFCFYDLPSGAANGSCWSMNIDEMNSPPTGGPCQPVSESGTLNNSLTWAIGWCPSRYSPLAVASLGIYLMFFAPGMGPMPWTINSEIFPMWARSFCNSVATSTNWFFNLLISMTFLTLTEVLTKEGAFFLYAGLASLGVITFFFILPETKGKTLEEMENLFAKPWCSRKESPNQKNIQYVHIRGLNRDGHSGGDISGDSDS